MAGPEGLYVLKGHRVNRWRRAGNTTIQRCIGVFYCEARGENKDRRRDHVVHVTRDYWPNCYTGLGTLCIPALSCKGQTVVDICVSGWQAGSATGTSD
jgi:hypothetical protein